MLLRRIGVGLAALALALVTTGSMDRAVTTPTRFANQQFIADHQFIPLDRQQPSYRHLSKAKLLKRIPLPKRLRPKPKPKPVVQASPSGGLAQCIIHTESGGNPSAVNGQYHGIAQWSPEAWARMGGLKYASDPLDASYGEQVQVLNDGLARYGCNDWCPYDPC